MSGPRSGLGLVILSGEIESDERSEDSDEALFSLSCINCQVKQNIQVMSVRLIKVLKMKYLAF